MPPILCSASLQRTKDPKSTWQSFVRPTLSIGLATFPEDADSAASLLARADEALYRAKQQGRNRVDRAT